MSTAAPLAALLMSACASAPTQTAADAPAAEARAPNEVHWVRTAAEHRAIFLQTYRTATDRLRDFAEGRQPGTWAVILDADETVLDNSEYQRRLAVRGESFDPETWNDWVREGVADSLPGAAGFIRTVRELGGRVAIVTNRDQVVCPETRTNLQQLSMRVDAVLCQSPGESGKDGRFRAVREGTTGTTLPPLDVLMHVGDNIQDFPGLTQHIRNASPAAFDNFGRTWFLLPNPMYGSWEDNPPR
ncbi:MAG TPA: HAD family acid phosphatase [Longimicrobiales bacterium]|nr:HAD family acid phosphatase [Longimicrobiales bacterium]